MSARISHQPNDIKLKVFYLKGPRSSLTRGGSGYDKVRGSNFVHCFSLMCHQSLVMWCKAREVLCMEEVQDGCITSNLTVREDKWCYITIIWSIGSLTKLHWERRKVALGTPSPLVAECLPSTCSILTSSLKLFQYDQRWFLHRLCAHLIRSRFG